MPLPSDPKLLQLSKDLVAGFHAAFGPHPTFRATHARGLLLTGTFTPTSEASSLSIALHFNNPSTSLLLRFSSFTGLPQISDTDPQANPRGLAVRFVLGDHKHTDIVAHSTPLFPTRTGEEFGELLKALGSGDKSFLESHPAAAKFVQAPKPSPESFVTEKYWSVSAFKLIGKDGKETLVRWQLAPDAGTSHLSAEDLSKKAEDYLYADLHARFSSSSSNPVTYSLLAQIAEPGDVTDDATVQWPDSRKIVSLGKLKIEGILSPDEKNVEEQRQIIFDPVPRVEGVESSNDPLTEVRAGVYLVSGKERRAGKIGGD